MAKKILIVGSQGYLGSHLVGYLSSRGYECKGIDTGFFSKGMLREIYSEDVVNKDARAIVKDDLNGFDVLILLAGISNDPFGRLSADQIYNPSRDYALSIATICKEMGIKFIYPSSCSVYGAATDGFLSEDKFGKACFPSFPALFIQKQRTQFVYQRLFMRSLFFQCRLRFWEIHTRLDTHTHTYKNTQNTSMQ